MRGKSFRRRRAAAGLWAGLIVLSVWTMPPVCAHEMGAGRVEAVFTDDGRYRIDVRIDPEMTLRRLELEAGQELSGPGLEPSRLEDLLLAHRGRLLEAMTLRFDGEEVTPRHEIVQVGASQAPSAESPPPVGTESAAEELLRRLAGPPGLEAVLRLSGEVPAGARTFTWAYSLSAAPYALTLRDEREDT
ncbi:MAG: hypothetical protein KDD47_26425, partial [Acidobacteria bacterium]|nr:hypothetical protein [Acidobacteriota bacterium]